MFISYLHHVIGIISTTNDRSPSRRGLSPEKRSGGKGSRRHLIALVDLDPRLDDPRMEAVEDLQPIFLYDNDHKTYMGTSLKLDDREMVGKTLIKKC